MWCKVVPQNEDLNRKRKHDVYEQLVSLENAIPNRTCVQNVYTRWMTRDDPTVGFTLKSPPAIFGIPDTYVTTIDVDDIITFWKRSCLDCSIIFSFML